MKSGLNMLMVLVFVLLLFSCGYTSKNNESLGQVKKVANTTPLIFCPDYNEVDISLGVMRNGVGSMSTEDVWLEVDGTEHLKILKTAAETGKLVKFEYNVRRFTICVPERILTRVTLVE